MSKDIFEENKMLNACQKLIAAYRAGEESGSVAWEDVDDAYVEALDAVASCAGKTHIRVVFGQARKLSGSAMMRQAGTIVDREFATEAEARAYKQALDDARGWVNNLVLHEERVQPKGGSDA